MSKPFNTISLSLLRAKVILQVLVQSNIETRPMSLLHTFGLCLQFLIT